MALCIDSVAPGHIAGAGAALLGMAGTIRMEAAPSYILLAHELIHADRSGQPAPGGATVQFGAAVVSNANRVLTSLQNGWIRADGTMELAEEVATVGLSG